MKNRLLSAVFTMVILLSLLSGCAEGGGKNDADSAGIIPPQTAGNDVKKTDYESIAQTDTLELKFNKDTTHFIVVNRQDQKEYSSLPAEELAGSIGRHSLFDISYMTESGSISSMSSYEDSVAKGQYKIETVENGVKILFTLGNVSEKLYCPTAFTVARFDELTGKIESAFDRNKFKSMYYKVDIETVTDSAERSSLLSKYPRLKEEPMYVLKNETLSLSVKRNINEILVATGYNDSDYAADMEGLADLQETQYPIFNVAVYLQLDEQGLRVKIPTAEVSEFNGGKLLSIDLLKYFAAPAPGTEGWFLLPDASGSRMDFYNGKNDMQMYSVSVYGSDRAINASEKIYRQDVAYLPVFANVKADGSVFCRITDAAAIASINATPGAADAHASAYASFQFRQVSQTYLNSTSKEQGDFFYVTQDKLYDGSMELLYTFFTAENSNLNAFAQQYRKTLFPEQAAAQQTPLMLEFIGVDRVNASVMGVSAKRECVYTSLAQVLEILKDLKNGGVGPMNVKLSGFFTKGLSQPYAAGLKLNSKVGDADDLKNLTDWAAQNDVDLYFDVDIQYVYSAGLFDYNARKNTVSMINKEQGKDYGFNPVTYQLDTAESFRYMLNPAAITKAADRVVELADELGTGFSLTYVGSDVNADYRKAVACDRQTAFNRLMADVERVAQKAPVITNGANAGVLPYVSAVTDVPMRGMQYDICDEVVPFLQMVLGGNVHYYDQERNTSGDTDSSLLDAMRTGAGLSYVLTADEDLVFTKTDHSEYTTTQYSVWKDKILQDCKAMAAVSGHTASGIVNSKMVGAQMYKTDYADGSSMVVNYSGEGQQYAGKVIEPFGYIVLESGEQ